MMEIGCSMVPVYGLFILAIKVWPPRLEKFDQTLDPRTDRQSKKVPGHNQAVTTDDFLEHLSTYAIPWLPWALLCHHDFLEHCYATMTSLSTAMPPWLPRALLCHHDFLEHCYATMTSLSTAMPPWLLWALLCHDFLKLLDVTMTSSPVQLWLL